MIWRIVFIYFIFIFYTRYREKCVSLLVGCEWCCSCFTRTHSHTLALQYKDRNTAAVFIRNSLSNPSHVAKKKKKKIHQEKKQKQKKQKKTPGLWKYWFASCLIPDVKMTSIMFVCSSTSPRRRSAETSSLLARVDECKLLLWKENKNKYQ